MSSGVAYVSEDIALEYWTSNYYENVIHTFIFPSFDNYYYQRGNMSSIFTTTYIVMLVAGSNIQHYNSVSLAPKGLNHTKLNKLPTFNISF